MKTRDLIGPALDWAVAKCEGETWVHYFSDEWSGPLHYSTDWSQGGPIIDRERITPIGYADAWQATSGLTDYIDTYQFADYDSPTSLIAAMRHYVANKLGNEIEIPEELL